MKLTSIILSALEFVLCGLAFLWGMIAAFRPDRLRRYEARITHIDRLGIRPAEYQRGPGIAIAGVIAMLISLAGIIQAVETCLDHLPLYQHQSALRSILSASGVNRFPGLSAVAPDMTQFFTH